MKKTITILLVLFTALVFGQNMQVQNMVNYLRNKDYPKAKAAADAAAVHEQTAKSPKMWMYRGNVYKAIADTSAGDQIDPEAAEKALEAYVNCWKYDPDSIYKTDMKGGLVLSAAATSNKANYYMSTKQYDKALRCYDLLESAVPFDAPSLKRRNITREKLVYDKFEVYKASGNKAKMTEYVDRLIEMRYRDPKVYTDMMDISLKEKDTAAALGYIEKGKVLFEDNMALIGTEIDIYLARKKSDELKDKLRSAIEVAPDNEVLYVVLGQIYERTNELDSAEKKYLKAVELKPEYEAANYKLGALYFNKAADYNKKLNDLPPKETAKAKEYEAKVVDNFKKAIPYLEKSYEIKPDAAYKQRLFKAYARLGDTEKAAKYK